MTDSEPLGHEAARAAISAPGEAYETHEVEVRGVPLRAFVHSPANLGELYAQSLAHADRDFLVYEGERLTFAETHARAAALATWLVEDAGVPEGARVAIAMRNYPEWVVAFMAVTATGRIAVPMNAWWTADEMAYGIEDSGARWLLLDQERLDRIAPRMEAMDLHALVARPTAELPARARDMAEVLAAHAGVAMPAVAVDPEADATIMYTSGTTGFPKGAVSTHRAITGAVLAFESNAAAIALRNPDAVPDPEQQGAMLLTVPLFHVTGCHAIFLTSFRPGRKMVLMYKWNAEQALGLIEAERVTAFTGVPTMTWEMLQVPDFDRYDTSSLVSIGGGGAPAPPEQVRQVEARFAGRPGIGYGLTETNAVGAQNAGDDYMARPRSTGRPPLTVEIEAFADDGTQQPRGILGEIRIRGPVVIRCYWNKPEATAETIVDGWLCTGDIGRVDDEGFVYIEDRKKDMVLRGGENVYCAEVEAAIYDLEGVREAIVFGVPDERLGEEVAAVIVFADGVDRTAESIRAELAAHIAKFKIPAHIRVQTDELPRNASGKFLKRAVRDELVVELGRG
jgi:long-chain acyl-CoA synthetase